VSSITHAYSRLKGDKLIWLIVTILAIFSVLAVYSAVGSMAYKTHGGNTELLLLKQTFFLGVGLLLMYVAYKFDYMLYAKWAPLLLLIAIPLLAYTMTFGPEINNAQRWLTIPFLDQRFQTSDFAKLALIIFLARSISNKQEVINDLKSAIVPLIIPVIIVCSLIMPDDLSTAALLFFTCFLMMIIGRVKIKHILLLIVIGIAACSLVIILGSLLPDSTRLATWSTRITTFFVGGTADAMWQVNQAKIAIAEGGWFGVGPGNSIQRNYLPVPYADYIYAIICEEYGLLGGLLILALYLGLLIRCTKMVTQCPKTFGAILAMGLCLNLVVQAFANIAVSVNLLPVTGLTLPLISMGGTSLIMTCISLGIILSVSRYVETAKLQQVELTEIEEDESNH